MSNKILEIIRSENSSKKFAAVMMLMCKINTNIKMKVLLMIILNKIQKSSAGCVVIFEHCVSYIFGGNRATPNHR